MYYGCNVENAAYPSGICAERGALCSAIASEGKSIKFDHCVVVTDVEQPAAPCGLCRQMIAEFGTDIMFTCLNKTGSKIEMSLE